MDYLSLVIWMAVLFGSFYLFLILPQKRRDKKVREMLAALEVGNQVVTQGGIIGKIINIKDDEVIIETSVEKTQIKLRKSAVQEVRKEEV